MTTTTVRAATAGDMDAIVALTRAQRHQLAAWSPVYFNPRDGADEGHAGFLGFMVASGDHDTVVAERDGEVVSFLVRIPHAEHLWLDDLCISDTELWGDVLAAFEPVDQAWVTCVSIRDDKRVQALADVGAGCVSRYWVRPTAGIEGHASEAPAPIDVDPTRAARHAFGGRAFVADLPGGLAVPDGQGGYAIGSPSVTPPIYDPGGPTCVIDQVVGVDQGALVDAALAACAARGDAQVLVVCSDGDTTLERVLMDRGFTPEVLLIGKV